MNRIVILTTFFFLYINMLGYTQQTYYVLTTGQDKAERDGKSPATAWKSLAYACQQVSEGKATIELGAGTFAETETAYLKSGFTIVGQGNDKTIVTNANSFVAQTGAKDYKEYRAQNYLVYVPAKRKNITIKNIKFTSPETNLLHGAINIWDSDIITIENVAITTFSWNGLRMNRSDDIKILHCDFHNASLERHEYNDSISNTSTESSGAIRALYHKHVEVAYCTITSDKSDGYGYKGGGHEDLDFHDNTIEITGYFGIEIPHENEAGVNIYNNQINRCISVPKTNGGADPRSKGFEYAVWIHNNTLGDSYGVEGPRNYLRITDNHFLIRRGNGRIYTQHGGTSSGPVLIAHNAISAAKGVTFPSNRPFRGFVFVRGTAHDVDIFNNTVYLHDGGWIIDVGGSNDISGISGWQVRNNVFVGPTGGKNEHFFTADASATASQVDFSHNIVRGLDRIPQVGSTIETDPQLNETGAKPVPYFVSASATSAVVDAGTDVGLPYKGAAPDIGAYEWNPTSPPSPPADTENPSPPTLAAGAVSENSVALSWSKASDNVGVTSYELFQGSTKIKALTSSQTSYTVTDLQPNTQYIFLLKALDAAGNQGSSNGIATTTKTPTPVQYTISASVTGGNGSISPSGSVKVVEGKDQTFTITPNVGYQIKDVTVDGSSQGAISSYTFNKVTKNHTLSALLVKTPVGTTYYVATDGKDEAGRDGKSPATAWKSLDYASEQVPEGEYTIELSQGTFVIGKTVRLKNGWTLIGQGHTGSNTTTITNASTFSPEGAICLPLSQERNDFPLENYLIGGNGLENVTISNLVLTSRLDQPLDGAIMMKYARNLELFNLTVREFPWNGIYLREGKQVRVHHSLFENASYERRCNTYGGAIRTRYMNAFTLDHCEFELTKGWGYGYKGSGHENTKVHDNVFHGKTTLGPDETYRPFDFESAHEFEWGLEIYNNTFNGMVSVPKSNEQGLQSNGGAKLTYLYSIRIHHNTFYGSAGVEGPRSHLEIDHNYFAQKWNNNGRVYEIHGASTDNVGPTSIHHNVAECSMGFVFKKNKNSPDMSIYNNTVYLVNSTRNNFPTSFLEVSGPVSNWQVKNNLVFTLDEPNSGTAFSRGSLPSTGMSLSHNLAWNIPATLASVQQADPGLALSDTKPTAYYLAKDQSSTVVDAGTDVGFPFQGTAPDIGAYEWNNASPSPAVEYTISASVTGGNGSISPSGNVSVEQDKNKTFTIMANEGYQIKDVLVDGSSVGKLATYTFTSVTANHTISATFALTSSSNKPVTAITVSGPATITTDGGSAQLEATVDPGDATNKSVTWSIQGADLGASVSATGLLTASGEDTGNGTLTVRATAQDDSKVFDDYDVAISNQADGPTPDTEAPSVPILTATDTTAFSATLSWQAATDNIAVTNYRIYQDEVLLTVLDGSMLTHTVTSLQANTAYIFVVEASDGAGNTNQSDALTLTTLGPSEDTTPPTASVLQVSTQTETSVSLMWTLATDDDAIAFYYLYQDGEQTVLESTMSSYTTPALSKGTYTFWVVAVDQAGNLSESSNMVSVTIPPATDTEAPSTFEMSTIALSFESFALNWTTPTDNTGLAYYLLYQDGEVIDTLESQVNTYTLESLAGGTYLIILEAYDQAGNSTAVSLTLEVPATASPVEQPVAIRAEKILSPNQDQQNDLWRIAVAEDHELSSVKIYSRSGQEVFAAGKNYQDQPWNGIWQGQPLATGAYYFVITYSNTVTGTVSTATGSIALIR